MNQLHPPTKRKYSNSAPADPLVKRQRQFDPQPTPDIQYLPVPPLPRARSRSSLSDNSDIDEDDTPTTPANLDTDMDWAPESSQSHLPPNPMSPWRESSPNDAIHQLQLLREALPPTITTITASFVKSPLVRDIPPSMAIPMTLETRLDAYLLMVQLPGYNSEGITVSCKRGNVVHVVADIWHLPRDCRHQWDIAFDDDVDTADVRASMDNATNVLTLIAKRYRRSIPIELKVDGKPAWSSSYSAFHTGPLTTVSP